MRKIFISILCFFVVHVVNAQDAKKPIAQRQKKEQNTEAVENSRSRWDLVWRSAIVPGWGLIHAKAYRRGIMTLATTTIILAVEYDGHQNEASRKESYHQTSDTLLFYFLNTSNPDPDILLLLAAQRDSAQDVYEYSKRENELKLSLLGVKYLFQLGYTYWYGTYWEKEEVTGGFRFDFLPDTGSISSRDYSAGYPSARTVFSYNFFF